MANRFDRTVHDAYGLSVAVDLGKLVVFFSPLPACKLVVSEQHPITHLVVVLAVDRRSPEDTPILWIGTFAHLWRKIPIPWRARLTWWKGAPRDLLRSSRLRDSRRSSRKGRTLPRSAALAKTRRPRQRRRPNDEAEHEACHRSNKRSRPWPELRCRSPRLLCTLPQLRRVLYSTHKTPCLLGHLGEVRYRTPEFRDLCFGYSRGHTTVRRWPSQFKISTAGDTHTVVATGKSLLTRL
jgi:hypothetical protein